MTRQVYKTRKTGTHLARYCRLPDKIVIDDMQAWATWLRPTAGKLRVDCLAKRVCNAPDELAMLQGVNEACSRPGNPGNGSGSALFSIYIHPSPAHKGYPKGSIFHGREISPRVDVKWAGWGIVEV